MKNIFALLVLFALIAGGCTQAQTEQEQDAVNAGASGNPVTINVQLTQFEFTPNPITVKKGDIVTLNITSVDVPHGFSLPEFGVSVQPAVGETKSVTFTADKAGTFTFTCNVFCGQGHSNMAGQFVVEG